MRLLASDRHMYLNIQQLRTIDSTNYIFVYDVCNKNCFVISLSWIGESQQMYSDLISILDTKLAETKWIRTDFDSFFCRISQIVIIDSLFYSVRYKKQENIQLIAVISFLTSRFGWNKDNVRFISFDFQINTNVN